MAKKKKKKKSNEPKYVSVSMPSAGSAPEYTPGTYQSQYAGRINSALDAVTNFKYDPTKDANYQALAKVYGARGNIAAKDTLGDAAALNGGYGSSYAVSAAQQARNQYNQELAALIPDLEANAYSRAQGTYNALMDADNTAYGRFRDTEGDRQFQYNANYDRYRDLMADSQWGLGYNLDVANYKLSKKSSAGSGGGGGRRSSGGGGGYTSAGSSGGGNPYGDLFDSGTKVSKVHLWDKKNKKISDKKISKEIKQYKGKGR